VSIRGQLAFAWERWCCIRNRVQLWVCVRECVRAGGQRNRSLLNKSAARATVKICQEGRLAMAALGSERLFLRLGSVSMLL
jgi:hypothetical protein